MKDNDALRLLEKKVGDCVESTDVLNLAKEL
jgi:hypothetical protein